MSIEIDAKDVIAALAAQLNEAQCRAAEQSAIIEAMKRRYAELAKKTDEMRQSVEQLRAGIKK